MTLRVKHERHFPLHSSGERLTRNEAQKKDKPLFLHE